MILTVFMLLSSHLFCQDAFFTRVEGMPLGQKKALLEKRLSFISKQEGPLKGDKTLEFYLNLQQPNHAELDFILNLVFDGRNKNAPFLQKALDELLQPENRNWALNQFSLFEKRKPTPAWSQYIVYVIENISLDDLDWVRENERKFKNYLEAQAQPQVQAGKNKVPPSQIVRKMLLFGYSSLAKPLIKAVKKSAPKEEWSQFYHCQYLVLVQKLSEAKACYESNKESVWFVLGKLYVKYLQGQLSEKDQAEYNSRKAEVKGQNGKAFVLIYDVLFGVAKKQEIIDFVTGLEVKENYWTTFIFLELDKKIKYLSAGQRKQVIKNFKALFPNHILAKNIQGKNSLKELGEIFKENTITYQVLKFSNNASL
jgi:hypothetical protein